MSIYMLLTLLLLVVFNGLLDTFHLDFKKYGDLISVSLLNVQNGSTDNDFQRRSVGIMGRMHDNNDFWVYPLATLEIKYQRLKIVDEMFHSKMVYRRVIVAKGMSQSRINPEDVLYFNTSLTSGDTVDFGEKIGSVYYFRNEKSEDLISLCKGKIGNILCSGYYSFEEVFFVINCDFHTSNRFGIYGQKVFPDKTERKRVVGNLRSGQVKIPDTNEDLSAWNNETEFTSFGDNKNVANHLEQVNDTCGRAVGGVKKVKSKTISDDSEANSMSETDKASSNNAKIAGSFFSKVEIHSQSLDNKPLICSDLDRSPGRIENTQGEYKELDCSTHSPLAHNKSTLSVNVESVKGEENRGLFSGSPWFIGGCFSISVLALIALIARMSNR